VSPERAKETKARAAGLAIDSLVRPVSSAPSELFGSCFPPRAYALGYILAPLRGWSRAVLFHQLQQHSTRARGMHKNVTVPACPDLDLVGDQPYAVFFQPLDGGLQVGHTE
jgi:hypothetical protein